MKISVLERFSLSSSWGIWWYLQYSFHYMPCKYFTRIITRSTQVNTMLIFLFFQVLLATWARVIPLLSWPLWQQPNLSILKLTTTLDESSCQRGEVKMCSKCQMCSLHTRSKLSLAPRWWLSEREDKAQGKEAISYGLNTCDVPRCRCWRLIPKVMVFGGENLGK